MDNVAKYENQGRRYPLRVFFVGATAIEKGAPLAIDENATGDGTSGQASSSAWYGRARRVRVVAAAGDKFAGVAAESYAAKTGGQWITIYEPGSECLVYCKYDCSCGTILNWDYGLGYFMSDSQSRGAGAAYCLQDVDRSSTAGLVMAILDVGGHCDADT